MTTRTDTHRVEEALRRLPPVQGGGRVTGAEHYLPATPETVTWGWLPSGRDQPVLHVAPGDVVCVDTISHEGVLGDQGRDPRAFFGRFGVPADAVLADAAGLAASGLRNDPDVDGPHVVTGPIAVTGAQPGDVLSINVLELLPRLPYGVVSSRHGRGALPDGVLDDGEVFSAFCLVEPGDGGGSVGSMARRADATDGRVRFPLAPFLGLMGVAAPTRLHSVPPGAHGGNIDVRLLGAGATLHLPVQVPDALAYVGDPHFAQGDGEVALTALEAPLRATLRLDLVPAAQARERFGPLAGPIGETPDLWVPIGLHEDLDEAMRGCVRQSLDLLTTCYGMDRRHAYAYLSAATDYSVSQVVDVVKGVHGSIRKADLRVTTVPDGLLDAFWAYDRALLADDTGVLAELFAPGRDTLRADPAGVLVGHDRITAFRAGRTVVPTRLVTRVHVRPLGPGAAVVIAETRAPDGARGGLQTQVWEWQPAARRWRVCAAHVTPPPVPPTLDRTVWRVLGDPLLPGAPDGPLSGRTVAVKDLFAVRGHPVGAGNPTWLAEAPVADEHAAAVSALLGAGAAVAGIARTDEFAYSIAGTNAHYGTPPNPAAPDRVPGGSSNGCASAVSTGQADIGLGTDTAGSVRVPASYQGLFGLRSTHGLVATTGVLALAPSFDAVGWLTRDAATLAAVTAALVPAARRAPLTRGLVVPAVTALADEPVGAAFTAATGRLVRDGVLAGIDTAAIDPVDLQRWCAAFRTVQGHEAWALHGGWITAHPDALGPDVGARFAAAALIHQPAARSARAVLDHARAALRSLLEPGTVLLLPGASSDAPRRDAAPGSPSIEQARAATLGLTCLAGLAGAPAISMPLARLDGAPVGVSGLAAPGTDRDLTDLAELVTPSSVRVGSAGGGPDRSR